MSLSKSTIRKFVTARTKGTGQEMIQGVLIFENDEFALVLSDSDSYVCDKDYTIVAFSELGDAREFAMRLGVTDDRIINRETNPVKRLHNLCDLLQDHQDDSPYSQEAWDELQAENERLRNQIKDIESWSESLVEPEKKRGRPRLAV